MRPYGMTVKENSDQRERFKTRTTRKVHPVDGGVPDLGKTKTGRGIFNRERGKGIPRKDTENAEVFHALDLRYSKHCHSTAFHCRRDSASLSRLCLGWKNFRWD